MSLWVATQLLLCKTPKLRQRAFQKCIKIAKLLFGMRNFNGVIEVVAGFMHQSVWRLGFRDKLSRSVSTDYNRLLKFVQTDCNYRVMRLTLSNSKGKAHIPYFGLLLKDLIGLEGVCVCMCVCVCACVCVYVLSHSIYVLYVV